MAANVGRTQSKWVDFQVDDSAGTLRSIPVATINGVGVTYDEQELLALQDQLHNALPNFANAPIDITGPFDTTAAAASPALSGSHTVLSAINGLSVPLSLAVKVGVRHAWDAEPIFGLTASATSGYLCVSYTVDVSNGTYAARFVPYPGSSVPAWGTSAIT